MNIRFSWKLLFVVYSLNIYFRHLELYSNEYYPSMLRKDYFEQVDK